MDGRENLYPPWELFVASGDEPIEWLDYCRSVLIQPVLKMDTVGSGRPIRLP